jgi:anti-anti-sigma factor
MRRSNAGSGSTLRVVGEMTIYRAAELGGQLLGRLAKKPAAVRLDLSEVTEIDTAGLQLILMLNRVATAAGSQLAIVRPASCVSEVLALCNLGHLQAVDGAAA